MTAPDGRTTSSLESVVAAGQATTGTSGGNAKYLAGVCLVASLGGLLFGFDTAVISGTFGLVETQFGLSKLEVGWFGSSALVGCIMGAAVAGALGDRFGRKPVLMAAAVFFFVSALYSAIPATFRVLIAARIVGGWGVGMASVLAPIYISEFSPPRLRGRLVATYQLSIVIGILTAYFSNWLILRFAEQHPDALGSEGFWHWTLVAEVWRGMFGAEMIPAGLFFLLLFVVPESPRWLVKAGREARALRILARVNGPEIAPRELAEIRDALVCEAASLSELLRPGLRRALVLALGLAIFGQLTGVNIVVYYGPTVLEAAGLGLGGALQSQVLFGVINLLATLIAIWKVDRWGRRPLLIWGMALVTAAMTLTAVLLLSQAPAIWIVFLLCVYMGCVSVSICAVIWVLIPEVFPTRIRGRAVSIATFAVWATNTVSTLVFPWYVEACGVDAGFFTFAALCVAATIFFWHLVPETKGKSLEEIERQWLHRSQRSQHAQQGLLLLLVTAACGGVAATSAQPKDLQAPVLPAEAWVKATPESQGMSTAKLDALRDQSCPPLAAVSTPLSPGQAQNEIGPKGFLVPDGYSGLRVRELKPR